MSLLVRCDSHNTFSPRSRSPRFRAFSSREILPQSGFDPFKSPVDLIPSDHKRWRDADRVFMGVLGKNASALQRLTIAACSPSFRVKLDRQHQSPSAHLSDRVGAYGVQASEEARALEGCV